MTEYKNLGGNSNVKAYEIGDNFINVKFKDDSIYYYNSKSAGIYNINEMKKLALRGMG